MMIKSIYIAILFLLLTSCSPEEKFVDNFGDEMKLLISVDKDIPVLAMKSFPDGELIEENVFRNANQDTLPSHVTKFAEYKNEIYLFIKSAFKIYVIDNKTFKLNGIIDFSSDSLVPTDICFANSTDAYVCHENGSILSLVDIYTDFSIARKIQVLPGAASLDCSENTIYVAHPNENKISVVDTRTHSQISQIAVHDRPILVKAMPNGLDFMVISEGYGKSDNKQATAAKSLFIDKETGQITESLNLEFGSITPEKFKPIDLETSNSGWAFVSSDDLLLRVDARFRNKLNLVSRLPFANVKFSTEIGAFLYVYQQNNITKVSSANMITGLIEQTVSLEMPALDVHPL